MAETATCPLCGDYEGDPAQVEAHISGKRDEVHKGESGQDHRAAIEDISPEEAAEMAKGEDGDGSDGLVAAVVVIVLLVLANLSDGDR